MNLFKGLPSCHWLALLAVCVSVICICGCEKGATTSNITPSPIAPPAQGLSSNELILTGAKGDPATYVPNTPYIIDINADGTNDSVIVDGNTVTWKRNCDGPDIELLKINIPFHAYTFKVPPGKKRIALYVYDLKDDEHYAENLYNSSDGTPKFGTLEAVK